jgi:tryptophan synthase beta chain
VGVEAAGKGIASGHHSATLTAGTPGVLHGSLSYLLQDADGQVSPAHSISAGLDYPGVGPEHSHLRDTGRVSYETATDAEALEAFQLLCRLEGIIPALETAHALAWVQRSAGHWARNQTVLVCLSGRGDKDVAHVADLLGEQG